MKKTDYNTDKIDILIKKILLKSGLKLIHLEIIKKFLLFLLDKNTDMNLISRKLTFNEIIYDHIFDCLVCNQYFKKYSSITDLGSGGGFPGLLLAIIFPEKKIYLIEKSIKKANFLKETVELLNLKNVTIINDLVNEQKIRSEVITCRAFKDINTILSQTKDFFVTGGVYILYKGKSEMIKDELLSTKEQFKIKVSINKINKIKGKERHIIIIKKTIDQL